MTRINSSDIIYATVMLSGNQVTTLRLSGFTELGQLIKHIVTGLADYMGIFTLQLRNVTEGWTSRHSLRICA